MKLLKRNQIIILVIALMLVSAGYLNYTSIQENNTIETSMDETIEYAGIGDAKLVSSNGIVENQNEVALVPNEDQKENKIDENIVNEELTKEENIAQTTNSNINNNNEEYFSTSRLNREKMYSQMIESYEKILENEAISEAQKTIAQTEIKNINDIKNKIMICENLIKTKNIEDVIIFVNDKSISVIARIDTLSQEQIAQIQNIISREMLVDISNIHISNK